MIDVSGSIESPQAAGGAYEPITQAGALHSHVDAAGEVFHPIEQRAILESASAEGRVESIQ